LLSWIALTGISVAAVNFGLLKMALTAVALFARNISAFVAVPSDVVGIWDGITIASIFVWFQPLLLRLNAWRSIAWVSAVAFAFTASFFSVNDDSWAFSRQSEWWCGRSPGRGVDRMALPTLDEPDRRRTVLGHVLVHGFNRSFQLH
jgi:hypothetical protein